MQVILVGNHALRRENVSSILIRKRRSNPVLDVTCTHRALKSPDVCLKWKVVSQKRHVCLFRDLEFEWVSFRAGRTSEILEDNQCHFAAGRGSENCGVSKIVTRAGSGELRLRH